MFAQNGRLDVYCGGTLDVPIWPYTVVYGGCYLPKKAFFGSVWDNGIMVDIIHKYCDMDLGMY